MTNPAQRTIHITYPDVRGRDFLCVYNAVWMEVHRHYAKKRKYTAFSVWLMLRSNSNRKGGFYFKVSPKYAENKLGISHNTFNDALKVLEADGFLLKKDETNYEFNERGHISFSEDDSNVYLNIKARDTNDWYSGNNRYCDDDFNDL